VDLATMPIYVRAGAIIPFDPVRQYTAQKVSEPTTLRVYRGANGDYTLYDDDGISQSYLQGVGQWTRMTWNDGSRQLTIAPSGAEGSRTRVRDLATPREFKVLLLPEGTTKSVTYTGRAVTVTF
jgi:alpha-glucosidase/alpha-D-xyloside xylohydrolase